MPKVVEKKSKKVVKSPKSSLAHQGGKEKAKKVASVHVENKTKELKEELKEDKPLEIEISTTADDKAGKKERYYEAIGRRKESVAIVRLYTKKSTDTMDGDYALAIVNTKDYRDYFTDRTLQSIVESALRKLKSTNRFKVTVIVRGGGLSGQADAIKHGIARALVLFDLNFRKKLKKSGFLTRDSREKERRKYGLKKARKAPGWSKR